MRKEKSDFVLTRKKGLFFAGITAILLLAGVAGYLCLTPAPEGFPILEYHMVNARELGEERAYAVPPKEFCQQLDYLQEQGYTTITLLEFMKAKKGKLELPEKPIILTFDDGYEDNYTELLPILEERGMKAVVFMVTNSIGLEGYMTWEQLKDMQKRGIEIGSHTANHVPLTKLSKEEQAEEMLLSKLIMEWNGMQTIYSFSYPNGAYDADMREMLRQNEYLTAVTGDAGVNTFDTDPYLLQRVNIPRPTFGLQEFRFRLWKAELFAKLNLFQHKLRKDG